MSTNPTGNSTGFLANAEAARYLGVAPRTLDIWRCTKRHLIPFYRIGSRIFYRIRDLDTWMEANRVEQQGM